MGSRCHTGQQLHVHGSSFAASLPDTCCIACCGTTWACTSPHGLAAMNTELQHHACLRTPQLVLSACSSRCLGARRSLSGRIMAQRIAVACIWHEPVSWPCSPSCKDCAQHKACSVSRWCPDRHWLSPLPSAQNSTDVASCAICQAISGGCSGKCRSSQNSIELVARSRVGNSISMSMAA